MVPYFLQLLALFSLAGSALVTFSLKRESFTSSLLSRTDSVFFRKGYAQHLLPPGLPINLVAIAIRVKWPTASFVCSPSLPEDVFINHGSPEASHKAGVSPVPSSYSVTPQIWPLFTFYLYPHSTHSFAAQLIRQSARFQHGSYFLYGSKLQTFGHFLQACRG